MKKRITAIIFLGCLSSALADELPKECYGKYAGEMAAYTVMKNDVQLSIEKHDVHVQISNNEIQYSSGIIQLRGSYTFLKQSGAQYLIKANLTNGKHLTYQVDLLWNKKTRSLFLAGKNGEPDLHMVKLDL